MASLRPHRLVLALCLFAGLAVGQEPSASAKAPPAPTQNPFLWRIEGDVPSYLFGTFHLPDRRVTALHPDVQSAVQSCDAVFVEVQPDVKATVETAKAVRLPRGKTIADVLPPETTGRLKAFLEARDITLSEPLDRMAPWVLAVQVLMFDHAKDFLGAKPLDYEIYELAKDADKEVGGLETATEQLAAMMRLDEADSAAFLDDAIAQVETRRAQGRDLLDEMVRAYLGGEDDAFAAFAPTDKALAARLEKVLVIDRNVLLSERMIAKMTGEPKQRFFFAVGALHLLNEQGIVAMLRARGYTVTRLPVTASSIDKELRDLERRVERLQQRIQNLRRQRDELVWKAIFALPRRTR